MKYIDFKKYKRFFVFGCSFTNHMYPTWANVVASEMPNIEFHNFGLSGAGNLLINIRLSEANTRFKFCETDLIMTMYTTFYREDRWVNGEWLNVGNVYNNDKYDKNFIQKYADDTGYVIRDLALINSTYGYIKSLPCDSFFMMSSDWTNESKLSYFTNIAHRNEKAKHTQIKDVLNIYSSMLENNFPPPMFSDFNESFIPECVEFIDLEGNMYNDPHPTPDKYREYLIEIGFPLTERSEKYVNQCMNLLSKVKHQSDFAEYFADEEKVRAKGLSGEVLF